VVIFDGADRLDVRLAYALQLAGRTPFSRIAEVLGVSDHTVARRYARLREAGTVRLRGLAEPDRVGLTQWLVRLECMPGVSVRLAEALARRPDTAWISLNSGGTQVLCVLRTAQGGEEDLLLRLLPNAPRVTSVSAHCALHTFFGYHQSLLDKSDALTPAQITALDCRRKSDVDVSVELGDEDRAMLEVLSADGRASLAELAAATGWSQTTVRRRMAELHERGALYFDVELDMSIMGPHVRAALWLSVAPDRLTAAGEALARHQATAYVAATTGTTNLYASVVAPTNEDLYRYLTTEVAALPGVQHLETAPTIRTVKMTGRVGMG
jgi:DNA-binding Lrp family transcriptional regulator